MSTDRKSMRTWAEKARALQKAGLFNDKELASLKALAEMVGSDCPHFLVRNLFGVGFAALSDLTDMPNEPALTTLFSDDRQIKARAEFPGLAD